jgi:hypothetical protein
MAQISGHLNNFYDWYGRAYNFIAFGKIKA